MLIDPDDFENSLSEQLALIRLSLTNVNARVSNIYTTVSSLKNDVTKSLTTTGSSSTSLDLPESAVSGVPSMGIGKDLEVLGSDINDAAEKFEEATRRQGENQERGSRGLANAISGIAGALMVQQIASMRLISQPYQYITQPALSTLSTMGAMGDVLSSGLSAQESVLQEYRSMAPQLGGGMGAFVGSAIGGVPGAVIGGMVGSLAGTVFNEPIANFIDDATGNMSEKAFEMAIGQKFINAEQYGQFVRGAMTPMLGLGLQDDLVGGLTQGLGTAAMMMNYGPEVMSQIMTSYQTSLPSSVIREDRRFSADVEDPLTERGRIIGLANLTASLESRGMSREASLDLYSTISRSGSQDIIQSVSDLLISATAAGQSDDYTLNVLVPALARVTESRSIRNIARSSEEVEKGTSEMFAYMSRSGRLGDMISKNPDAVLSQIFGMISQTSEAALNDPARMMFLNNLGVSFMDVVTENENVLYKPLEFFANLASFSPNGEINRDESLFAILQMLNVMGISLSGANIQYGFELLEATISGDQEKVNSVLDEIAKTDPLTRIAESVEALVGTDKGDLLSGLTTQSEQFFSAMAENEANMNVLLQAMQGLMSDSSRISTAVQSASVSYIDALIKMLENAGFSKDDDDFLRELMLNRDLLETSFDFNSRENLDYGFGAVGGGTYVVPSDVTPLMFDEYERLMRIALNPNHPEHQTVIEKYPNLYQRALEEQRLRSSSGAPATPPAIAITPTTRASPRSNYSSPDGYRGIGGSYYLSALPPAYSRGNYSSPDGYLGIGGNISFSRAARSTNIHPDQYGEQLGAGQELRRMTPIDPSLIPLGNIQNMGDGVYQVTIRVEATSVDDIVSMAIDGVNAAQAANRIG